MTEELELVEERDSWIGAARSFPRAWKLLVLVGGALATVATTSAGVAVTYAAKIESFSTDAEVDAKVARATQEAIDREAKIRLAAAAQVSALKMQAEQDERGRRVIDLAVMRRLVSGEAADREERRALKAESARVARKALADQCVDYKLTGECQGESLEKASDLALDARR